MTYLLPRPLLTERAAQMDHVSSKLRIAMRQYISDIMRRSPAMRSFYQRTRDWFSSIELDESIETLMAADPDSDPLKRPQNIDKSAEAADGWQSI